MRRYWLGGDRFHWTFAAMWIVFLIIFTWWLGGGFS
jgi:hypothetical protein